MEPSSSAEMLAVLGSFQESFFRVLPKLVVALVILFVGWPVCSRPDRTPVPSSLDST